MQQEAGRPQKEICNTALWTLTRYYYFLTESQSGDQMPFRHCPDETHCADLRSSVGLRSAQRWWGRGRRAQRRKVSGKLSIWSLSPLHNACPMATTDPGDGFIEGLPESVASLMGHCRNKIIKKDISINHRDLPLLQNAFRV